MVCFSQNVQMDITTHYVLEHVVIVSMDKYVINMMVPVLVAANLIMTLHYVKVHVYFCIFRETLTKNYTLNNSILSGVLIYLTANL